MLGPGAFAKEHPMSNKHKSAAPEPALSYLARKAFTFAGRKYEAGQPFDDPAASGDKLERMRFARLIELASVAGERARAGAKRRADKVVHNPPIGG